MEDPRRAGRRSSSIEGETMKLTRRLLLVASLAGIAAFAPGVSAEPDAEAKRLIKKRDSERYEVKTGHSSTKAGCARVHIAAPTAVVKTVVTDYKNYTKLSKKFEKAKVVGRDGDKTDVYLQVPILKGAAKVWAVVRFGQFKKQNGADVLEGEMIKGNVKRLDAKWILKKIDDDNSQLNLELLILPNIPAPGSVVTGEVAYASDLAVMGARDRSEKKHQKSKKK
jgi:ribosome-associated toxin RatA of RatAB toxin-antitoxin module